ncbi:MAG TPA: zinc-binding dehydrogenase [Candidatus Dormibacteraeota bacterium]|nr:zinc-binding dehydrogenase [Candidatus Dormibacteraeota bacterium]
MPVRASAVWFARPGVVELREETLPEPGPSEILVRALRSAISQGTEMLVYRGQVKPETGLDLPTLGGSFAFPIKYGYASVGCVEQAGAAVEGISQGDVVFVHHPHQSAYVVPATSAMRLPRELSPEAGAFLANVETAVNVTLDAHPRLGDRVVVFGAGVVGLLVIQLLSRAGAAVIAVEPIERRRRLAVTAGAGTVLSPGPDVAEQVYSLTDGCGADLAIEVSGAPAALAQAIDSVGFQRTVVACSWYGTKPVSLDLGGRFHRGRVRILSSQVSNLDPALSPMWTMTRRMNLARDLLLSLQTEPLVTHRFAIKDAAEAYRLLDQRPEEAIQVLFTYV